MFNRKMTDAELLGCDLIVSDAYDDSRLLCEKLPGSVTVCEPLVAYVHARYEQGEKVFCCACGVSKHKRGYRVKCSDDTIRPLGNCCAKPRLGRDWVRGHEALKELGQRKKYLLILQHVCPSVLRAKASLQTWAALGSALRERQRGFFLALPDIYELLVQAARRDGWLEATERIQNSNWDPNDPGDEPRWKYLPVRHALAGRSFLRHSDPHEVVGKVDGAILNFARAARETDKQSTKQLQKVCTDLREAKTELERLAEMANAYSLFFTDENLNGIVRWAQLLKSEYDGRLRDDISRGPDGLFNRRSGTHFSYSPVSEPDLSVIRLLAT